MPRITLLEMLQQAGLIDAKQFDAALQNRVVYGGKIGTSLIELGFVTEVDLARFLSSKLAVPYVSPHNLKHISPETIAAIPRELALKYQAVPLLLEKKKLALAMVDPSDLKAVDEIAFATGFIIRPVIAPEVRLMEALAFYYQAEVDPRYLQIAKRLEEKKNGGKAVTAELKSPAVLPAAEPAIPSTAPARAVRRQPAEETSSPGEAARKPAAPLPADSDDAPAIPAPTTAEAEADAGVEVGTVVGKLPEAADEDWVGRVKLYSVDEFSRRLSRAEDREEIASILLDYLSTRFDRGALFTLRGGAAYGWRATGGGREIPAFHQFRLPLDSPSVLKTVADGGEFPAGPVAETVSNALLRQALGGEAAGNALVLPLTVFGSIVGVIYVDRNQDSVGEELQELKKLTAKAGLAFEILICREKILMS